MLFDCLPQALHTHIAPFLDPNRDLLRMLETCPWALNVYGKTIEVVRLRLRVGREEMGKRDLMCLMEDVRACDVTSLMCHRPNVMKLEVAGPGENRRKQLENGK